ncbi:MAG: protein-glutamate O-methyltransferase CheR [Thermoplasmata archaeon]|nr:protein-glutamate O-methyltransferase CheR [Thermoplasmata archaeon]
MEADEEKSYDIIRRHLLKTRGFDISGYSRPFLARAVRKRVGRSGCGHAMEYVALLKKSEDEMNELIAALSVNVTDFFRDTGAFVALTEQVIRPLASFKMELGWSTLRIWSAGCATGQEPYTIAICVAEELKKSENGGDLVVRIQGTDLSKVALNVATRGVYSEAQVKAIPKDILSEYFTKDDSGYQVSPSIRRMTKFSEGNLLDSPSQKYIDLIVCRNVVIYFSRPMHDVLVRNFHTALRLGGFLMLGRTETLMGSPRRLFEAVDHENRIFRKSEGEQAASQASDDARVGVSDSASKRST